MHLSIVCMSIFFMFFFFKQKTAYDIRISDWSSDVCSSDLPRSRGSCRSRQREGEDGRNRLPGRRGPAGNDQQGHDWVSRHHAKRSCRAGRYRSLARSEEHTSELQSLMRNSYAVFCLKKKSTTIIAHTYT